MQDGTNILQDELKGYADKNVMVVRSVTTTIWISLTTIQTNILKQHLEEVVGE